MLAMNRDDILKLGELSRIDLQAEEIPVLEAELSAVVSYVSVVQDIAADINTSAPQVGALYNVMREDEVTNEPDQYTEDILREMPATRGRHMLVKKILDNK